MRKVLYLFGILNDSDIDWLVNTGRRREIAANKVLVQQGVALDEIYIVLEGKFTVTVDDTGNNKPLTIATLPAGEIVGELSFLDKRPPSASVIAFEPSVVLAISRQALNQFIQSDTAFAARFYKALGVFLSDRLRNTIGQLGYGGEQSDVSEESSEAMDPELMDVSAIGAKRFNYLLEQFRGS